MPSPDDRSHPGDANGAPGPPDIQPDTEPDTEPDIDWSTVASILDVVLEEPEERRDAILADLCGGDPALRAEVEAMLQEEADAEAMFTGGVAALATSWDDLAEAVTSWERRDNLSGMRLGPYEVGDEIGHGGMGRVYHARRTDGGFEQEVAVKVIRRGLEPEAMQRFMAERRILAQLTHPGIARLLDGGVAPDGRPFLVMELVEGQPVTDFAAAKGCSLRQRLRLVANVCDAVHYAHTRLVIHRDLKPTNILVGPEDDATGAGPVAKLLDFGIAKALDDSLHPTPVQTRTGQFVVTPAYAAPEQLTGGEVTTATDVYALGAVLHELLVGHRPLPDATRETLMLRAQSSRSVPSPADAFDALSAEEQQARAAAMGTTSAALAQTLRGDLGTLLATALRADPADRYAGADALAGDLRRYLDDRPIEARPPTLRYRARKFAARNPAVLATSTLAVAALIAGLLLSLWQAGIAADERDRAQREAEKSAQAASFMRDLFRSNDPQVTLGDTVTVAEILARGEERVLSALDKQPLVQLSMANEIADIRIEMGNIAAAESLLVAARATLPTDAPPAPEIARMLYLMGRTKDLSGDAEAAEALHRDALAMRIDLYGPEHREVGQSLNQLASMLTYQGRYEDAEPRYREALHVLATTAGRNSDAYTSTVHNYAWMTRRRGHLPLADSLYREAYRLARVNLPPHHPEMLMTLNGLAIVRKTRGNYASADTLYRMVLREQQTVLGSDHPDTGISHSNLGLLLKSMGRHEEAARHIRSALGIWREAYGPRHPYVAVGRSNLGMTLTDLGQLQAAEQELRAALSIHREALPDGHPRIASTQVGLARVLIRTDRAEEASPLLWRAHEHRSTTLPIHHPAHGETAVALADLALARPEQAARIRPVVNKIHNAVCTAPDAPENTCNRLSEKLGR